MGELQPRRECRWVVSPSWKCNRRNMHACVRARTHTTSVLLFLFTAGPLAKDRLLSLVVERTGKVATNELLRHAECRQ
jgi:hypothetical protein